VTEIGLFSCITVHATFHLTQSYRHSRVPAFLWFVVKIRPHRIPRGTAIRTKLISCAFVYVFDVRSHFALSPCLSILFSRSRLISCGPCSEIKRTDWLTDGSIDRAAMSTARIRMLAAAAAGCCPADRRHHWRNHLLERTVHRWMHVNAQTSTIKGCCYYSDTAGDFVYPQTVTDRVSPKAKAGGSIRPSVCFHSVFYIHLLFNTTGGS